MLQETEYLARHNHHHVVSTGPLLYHSGSFLQAHLLQDALAAMTRVCARAGTHQGHSLHQNSEHQEGHQLHALHGITVYFRLTPYL